MTRTTNPFGMKLTDPLFGGRRTGAPRTLPVAAVFFGALLTSYPVSAAPPATSAPAKQAGAATAGAATTAPAPPPSAAPAAPPQASAQPGTTAPTRAADEEASTRFKRGLQLFDEGDYTLALVEFERAYQLAPNYRALYNIALVETQLGRYADAARTFEQYLHDGGDAVPASRRTEVQNTLAELRVRTATLEIATNVPAAGISLDGKPLDPGVLRAPMLIDAGEHTLRASAPGYRAGFKTFTLAGADKTTIHLDLIALPSQKVAGPEAPVPEKGRTLFWPGFVATGAFAAGAIVGGAFMLDARSRLSQEQNTFGSSAQQRSSTASQANSAALAADILTGLAVVTGGVSLYLSLRVDHSPRVVAITMSPSSLSLSGSF